MVDFLPPNQTHCVQAVDNNVGKDLRSLIYGEYDRHDLTLGDDELKVSAPDQRANLIKFTAEAVKKFNAERTALGM